MVNTKTRCGTKVGQQYLDSLRHFYHPDHDHWNKLCIFNFLFW